MAISITDARALYTKELAAVYSDFVSPTGFLRSFFQNTEKGSKLISIEVQRGTERVAVDVQRGTNGQRNTFNKSTEKIFEPPYYNEYHDATELAVYDEMFKSEAVSAQVFGRFVETVAEKTTALQDKIERAYEVQCSQVMKTGIVTLNNGTNIDFKRKAASLVAYAAGNNWASGSVSPYDTLETGCRFLREKGKMMGGTVNAIMGREALSAFLDNTIVKERADIRNYTMDVLTEAQRNSVGATYHGRVTAGSFEVDLWSYPQTYDNADGEAVDYMNSKEVVLLPQNPSFTLAFAAVPQLMTEGGDPRGAYKYYEHMDKRRTAHEFGVKSAGVAIPTAVDQLYTVQVLAS